MKNKFLGTFGDFGTFSFYYSHQITSGEGGMVVCSNKEDYNILFALRSHGWLGGTRFYNRDLKLFNLSNVSQVLLELNFLNFFL